MKLSSKIIKGALLIILAIGVFTLNMNILPAEPQQIATAQEHYFVNTALATDPATPPSATPPAATPAATPPAATPPAATPAATPPAATPAATPPAGTPETPKPAEPLKIPEDVLKTITKVSSYVFHLFNPLIYFFTKNIGSLLGNDYIYGGAMGEMLHLIWVVCRNIVNIVFVLILLFLALKHIFSGDENTDLKKTIPKFVIMLIAINFSWLACKVVLDAANVATNVVFAIPSGVQGAVKLDTNAEECKIIEKDGKKITNNQCGLSQLWYPWNATEEINMLEKDCLGGKTGKDTVVAKGYFGEAYPPGKDPVQGKTFSNKATYCWENLEIGKFSRTNAAYHLTYGMMQVQKLAKSINPQDSIHKVGIGTLFALIIQIVYLTAFGCLFIALIIRVAILWIFVATSPFLVLMYYLKDFQFGGSEKFSHMEFIKWAIAPAKVAGVWALGFIMVTTGQTKAGQLFATLDEQGSVTSKVFSVSSLFMGMESLQEFMWLILTVGIIWIGTFAVFSDLKVVSAITDKVNDAGKSVARIIGRSPQYLPIIPMIDPETGKLERKSYKQIFPRGFADGITRYGAKPEDKLPSALSSLKEKKNEKHLLGLQNQAKIGDHDGKQLHDALISGSGGHITHEGLKTMNESTLAEMLHQGAGVEEKRAKKIAKNIIDYANTVPETATAPVTKPEAGKPDMATAIRDGFQEALRTSKVKLEDLPDRQKTQLTEEMKQFINSGKSGSEAMRLALNKLNKDDEFKKALAALPKIADTAGGATGTGGAAGSTGSTGSAPARGGGAAGTVAPPPSPPAGGPPAGTP